MIKGNALSPICQGIQIVGITRKAVNTGCAAPAPFGANATRQQELHGLVLKGNPVQCNQGTGGGL